MSIRIPSHRPCLGPKEMERLRLTLESRWLGTEQLGRELVTLPLYFEMSDSEVEEIIAAVRSFVRQEALV